MTLNVAVVLVVIVVAFGLGHAMASRAWRKVIEELLTKRKP